MLVLLQSNFDLADIELLANASLIVVCHDVLYLSEMIIQSVAPRKLFFRFQFVIFVPKCYQHEINVLSITDTGRLQQIFAIPATIPR